MNAEISNALEGNVEKIYRSKRVPHFYVRAATGEDDV